MHDNIKTKANIIQRYISYILQTTLVIAFLGAIWGRQWVTAFLIIITLFLTFLPALIERNTKVFLPIEFEFIIIIFIYAGLFLGELRKWYVLFWWWDIMLHTISSIVLGLIGFLIIHILDSEKRIDLKMSPRFVAMFAFVFAVAIGAIWEIFEFMMDNMLGLNMQRSGLMDTMGDLIIDTTGALFISTIGYLWIKSGKSLIFNWAITKFVKENPEIFKNIRKLARSKKANNGKR